MNGNFWVIFLALIIGAVVGFGFGKAMTTRRMREILSNLSEEIKSVVDKARDLQNSQKQTEMTRGFVAKLGLAGFDTRYYKIGDADDIPEGFDKNAEVKDISELLTTMTAKGAMDSEIGRVVRYSMVVLDTEKLRLDWKRARADEGIDFLYGKYMNKEHVRNEGN